MNVLTKAMEILSSAVEEDDADDASVDPDYTPAKVYQD